MPRNVGTDIYYIPPGTEGFPDTTIESEKYNNYIHDVETDLNTPRPITAGGTGANDADEALANLGAEKSSQEVTNYDTHLFFPGSFYSAIGATNAPIAGHAFVGFVVSSDIPASPPVNQNVVVRAYDQSSMVMPGRIYVREKKAGVWSVWSQDNTGVASATPPVDPPDGLLWFDSEGGHLYVWYNDGNSKQWVIASPYADPALFLLKAGDTMEGTLGLYAPPTADLHAANKKYVDDAITNNVSPAFPVGTVMIFYQTSAPTGWTKRTDLNDVGIRIVSGSVGGVTGVTAWSTVFSQTSTGDHTLTVSQQVDMPVSGTFSGVTDPSRQAVFRAPTPQIGWTQGTAGPAELSQAQLSVSGSITGTATGGGLPHSHPITLNPKYVDVILATKD